MFKSNQLTQAKVHNYSKPNANAKPVLCTESRGARWEPVRCPSPPPPPLDGCPVRGTKHGTTKEELVSRNIQEVAQEGGI